MTRIVNKSGVRDLIREHDPAINVGADFYEELDARAIDMVKRAVSRAEENGRRTVKSRDA